MLKVFEFIVISVLVSLLWRSPYTHCKKIFDERFGSRHQMENEEGCESLYKYENIFVKKLFEMRKKLQTIQIQIQEMMVREPKNYQHGIKIPIEDFLHSQSQSLHYIRLLTNEFPTIIDDKGAKGCI